MADEAHALRRLLDNNPRDLGRDAISEDVRDCIPAGRAQVAI